LLILLLESAILIAMIKMVTDNETGFWTPLFISLLSAICTAVLANLLVVTLGLSGILVAASLSAALLTVALTVVFGTELKQSAIIGGIFVFVHIAIEVALYFLFSH
jgi:peptidoglycan biosynthesis protein MviN/MurJ (putative lipid II flippase)